jgi:hypothetical protein
VVNAIKPSEVRALDMNLEVVVIPVSNVDRASSSTAACGWRLDADFVFDDGFRVVRLTPPRSGGSEGAQPELGASSRSQATCASQVARRRFCPNGRSAPAGPMAGCRA